ncbi:MAG: hypothetical protein FJX36_17620 [Alphaproteobacteria bacterium]|nr:hypothetical protein [Alphaproteobacteria bacterium]
MSSKDRNGPPTRPIAVAFANAWWRPVVIGVGLLLLLLAPVVGLLPGPGGILVAGVALLVLLRYSQGAKRLFVRLKRRYPTMMWPLRKAIDQFRTKLLQRREARAARRAQAATGRHPPLG